MLNCWPFLLTVGLHFRGKKQVAHVKQCVYTNCPVTNLAVDLCILLGLSMYLCLMNGSKLSK